MSPLGLDDLRSSNHQGRSRSDRSVPARTAFYWAPGHIPIALEDSEYVDFSPIAEFRALVEHMQKVVAAAGDP
jgi:hypothetical protein